MKLHPEHQFSFTEQSMDEIGRAFEADIERWDIVPDGIAHMVAQVETKSGDTLFVKAYASNFDPLRVEEEMRFVDHLASAGLAVPSYIPTKQDGSKVHLASSLTGDHAVVISKGLHGTHPKEYSSPLLSALGIQHGLMHSVSINFNGIYRLDVRADYSFSDDGTEAIDYANSVGKSALEEVEVVWDDLPAGTTHLDIAKSNVLVTDKDSDLVGVIDFEDASCAPYTFCLAGTVWDIIECGGSPTDVATYIESYNLKRNITSSEARYFNRMLYLRGWIALHGALVTVGEESSLVSTRLSLLQEVQDNRFKIDWRA